MEIVLSLLLGAMLGAVTGWVASIVLKREDIMIVGTALGILGAALAGLLVTKAHLGGGPLVLILIDIAAAFLLVFLASLLVRKK